MSSNLVLDRFWREFSAIEPTAELGGIDADKAGYHNTRKRIAQRIAAGIQRDDYSNGRDVAADKRGADDVAAGIDLTMWPAGGPAMRKYTNRLKAAALTRDERLYLRGGPTLREFIGTDDGQRVYCYVFTGGVALGVDGDSGPDWGRADTHLWHIHLSIIRQYAEDWPALDAVLSVLKGESLAAWRARTETEDDMLTDKQAKQLGDSHFTLTSVPMGDARVPAHVALGAALSKLDALAGALAQGDAALRAQLEEIDREATERAALAEQRAAELTAEVNEVAGETVEALGAVESEQEIAERLRAILGDRAAEVGRLLAA